MWLLLNLPAKDAREDMRKAGTSAPVAAMRCELNLKAVNDHRLHVPSLCSGMEVAHRWWAVLMCQILNVSLSSWIPRSSSVDRLKLGDCWSGSKHTSESSKALLESPGVASSLTSLKYHWKDRETLKTSEDHWAGGFCTWETSNTLQRGGGSTFVCVCVRRVLLPSAPSTCTHDCIL